MKRIYGMTQIPILSTLRPTFYWKTSNRIHRECSTSIRVKSVRHVTIII